VQETPGIGGRWVYWRCQAAVDTHIRQILVAWQLGGSDDPAAALNARDEKNGARHDYNAFIENPRTANAPQVAALFTKPVVPVLGLGGVAAAGCKPSLGPGGLGNPWHCELNLGPGYPKMRETVLVRANGSFQSSESGRGCCVRVR
jgi:hypothetical protein